MVIGASIMNFGKVSLMPVCTLANLVLTRKISAIIELLPENVGCLPLAVDTMKTANGRQSTFSGIYVMMTGNGEHHTFSGRNPKSSEHFRSFSDLYRVSPLRVCKTVLVVG